MFFFTDRTDDSDGLTVQRDRGWKIFPYACIGQFRFNNLSLSQHPLYSDIVSRLSNGD